MGKLKRIMCLSLVISIMHSNWFYLVGMWFWVSISCLGSLSWCCWSECVGLAGLSFLWLFQDDLPGTLSKLDKDGESRSSGLSW